MQNILVYAPMELGGPSTPIAEVLTEAGHIVFRSSMDRGTDAVDALCRAFEGRPPDVLLADLSTTYDCLAIRHVMRLLQQAWGDDMPRPACLALLDSRHLAQPDWLAAVDDFILPPYTPREALSRIDLLLFRKRHVLSGDTLSLADLTLDLAGGRAMDPDGRVLPLTPREYDLLRFLGTHRGKFFARDRLLDMVWGVDFDGGERTVDIHIRRLRAKLPPITASLLETRRGVGYGLLPPGL
ncbi:winged helix-turn-helix domain-containing protein [Capsulimonas corticalis]|nr:response regulator transcription factor [Capsulimonas corticalis]